MKIDKMSDSRKRLPGSEKLTRPEDLKALSKYLGEIKRIQEEHTSLETDNLEVPGRTTGRLPNITSLPDSAVGLEAGGDVFSLDETRIDLDAGRKVDLSDYIETLDAENPVELEERKIGLEGNQKEVELSEAKIELSDTRDDISLSEGRVNLDNTTSGQVLNLSEFKENLEVEKNQELDETRINLEVKEEVELGETRINLEKPEDINLDETKINLGDVNDVELKDTRINLEKPEDIELGDTRINLEEPEDIELDDTRINLEEPEDVSLDDTKISLGETSDVGLTDKRVGLNVSSKEELDNTKITIEDDRDIDLSNYLESLDSEEISSLDNTSIKGPEKVEVAKLYDTVLAGPDRNDPDSLSDTKVELRAKEKVEGLGKKKLNITPEEKIEELGNSVLVAPESTNENGWNGEELYNSLMLAPDDKKYEKIMEMSSSMGNWGSKVASLVSAVLTDSNISADRASWFDTELKKLLYQMGALSKSHVIKAGRKGDNSKAQQLSEDLNNWVPKEDDDPNTDTALDKYRERIVRPEDSNSNKSPNKLKQADPDTSSGELILRPAAANSDTYVENSGNPNEEKKYSLVQKLFELYDNPYNKDNNKQGYKTIPNYDLPRRGILDALNINNYIRYGAEELFKTWDPKTIASRKIKGILLNETLALMFLAREQLEKVTKSNRDRLPGDDMGMLGDLVSGGVSGALGNLKDNAMSAIQNTFAGARGINKLNPLNRPKTKWQGTTDGQIGVNVIKQPTTGFELGNDRDETLENAGLGKNLGKNLVNALIGDLADGTDALKNDEFSFKKRYIEGSTGMAITLMDLCNLDATEKYNLGSVEQLQELLKQSPYITTPAQFGTSEFGKYKTMTLDSNAYWEVTIEPFCHYAMNGGYSFLPAIQEINWQNAITHGTWKQGDKRRTVTNYHKWVPIIGFELEKSRLTTKSLGLYDGEINYPISSELTNELRMTIADDQYKSWRNYFQKCADVAVYSSEAHDQLYYNEINSYEDLDYSNLTMDEAEALDQSGIEDLLKSRISSKEEQVPTVVDKSRIAVASYKNITFRVKIYIMTPQYSTIRRFDLLCVLKDFQESYSGDIDAGGYDLNVAFSIVGENPPTDGEFNSDFARVDVFRGKETRFLDSVPDTKTVNKSSSLIKLL